MKSDRMKTILDKKSLFKLLEESNLRFFSSGILNVNDPFFITRWNINKDYFQSTISYSYLENESFIIPLSNEDLPRSWNQFGFNQSFFSEEYLNAPYHRNKHVELHYVAKGSFTLKVNQKMIKLQEGDVCIINPHCYHSDIIGPDLNDLELYIIGINEEAFSEIETNSNYPIFYNAFEKRNNASEYILMHNVKNIEPHIRYLEANIKDFVFQKDGVEYLDKLFKFPYTLHEEVNTVLVIT